MNKKDKTVNKFLNNLTSFQYIEIEKIMLKFGFIVINTKGSHRKLKHHSLKEDLVIPVHNNDCNNFYKKLSAKIVKKIYKYEKID